MSNQNNSRFWSGRGYYIALILCACAIGIWGYVYAATGSRKPPEDTPVIATETIPVRTHQPTRPVREPTSPEPTEPSSGKRRVCMPVDGEILCGYAMECLAYNETTRDWRVHTGIDLGAAAGTPVRAAADGEVYTVYEDEQMGTTVVIRHEGGYTTRYASLAAETAVKPGDTVEAGQTIGYVGTTALMESALGEHVHFTVLLDDSPVDPEEFLKN